VADEPSENPEIKITPRIRDGSKGFLTKTAQFDKIKRVPFPQKELAHISDQALFCGGTSWTLR
jgi:hypothetical protein